MLALPMKSAVPSEQLPEELPTLRAQFPVLENVVYLNAGTDGPLPAAAVNAAHEELARQAREGRMRAHFERRRELGEALRASYAELIGARPDELALTTCTSEGISVVASGLALGPGDEILTSDEEHPGLLGALQAVRDLRGVSVRVAALRALPEAVGPKTKLVACSHVSWVGGAIAPQALAEVAQDLTLLIDGAQGIGAIPVDVHALGAHAYAGSGQKWLCGPDGLGMLYVSPALQERLQVWRRGYTNMAQPDAGLSSALHADARRFDSPALSGEATACALAALRVLADAGWPRVHRRARWLAGQLATQLRACGREVTPRGGSTLVSFSSGDPPGERARLAERGVVVREIPKRALLRASVGGWNNEQDLGRLLEALDAVA
jgi:selenocysteine lyase/cysteine desulfurase